MSGNNAHSVYISEWLERHWIRSIFAPGAHILQAVTRSHSIASGFGDTRQDALNRCLGETVEDVAELRGSGRRKDTAFDGLAAGQSSNETRLRAFFEALERVEISHWWAGHRETKQVSPHWLDQHGFTAWVDRMRAYAYARRRTAVWRVTSETGFEIIICKTSSPIGQDPIFGFGASHCVFDAVRHALREALQMEVNLIEIFATRGGYSETDTSQIESKIAEYHQRAPDLLRADEASLPDSRRDKIASALTPDASFEHVELLEGWCVWTCQLDDPIYRIPGSSSPFMNSTTKRPNHE